MTTMTSVATEIYMPVSYPETDARNASAAMGTR
jgi:hypothetical protein